MSKRIVLHRLGYHHGPIGLEPSCGVMDIVENNKIKYRLVTDCGLIPNQLASNDEKSWFAPDLSLFEDGVKIDAVRITHVHGDHVGFLPALAPYLKPTANIYMTRPSAAMIEKILLGSLHINEQHKGDKPFTAGQMMQVLNQIAVIDRPGEIEILPDIVDYVHPAGHIKGACSFTTKVFGRTIHYSGDQCNHDQPSVKGAELLPPAWWPNIIANSDCTYGADPASNFRTRNEEVEKACQLAFETIQHGAPVLFPSFGIGRGGDIAHELEQRGLNEIGRIFLDGACRKFTEIAQSADGRWCDKDQPLAIRNVRLVENHRYREKIIAYGKAAIIAPPGMFGPGGVITFYRRYILPNPDAALIFTGYVAPGTDGDKIITATRERDVGGPIPHLVFNSLGFDGQPYSETLPVRCKVLHVRAGGHNPQVEILKWFRAYNPEVAVLTHGSPSALASVEKTLRGDIKHLIRADLEHTVEIDV